MDKPHHIFTLSAARVALSLSALTRCVLLIGLSTLATATPANTVADSVQFLAVDVNGHPLEHVVISLHDLDRPVHRQAVSDIKIMDQRDLQFAPTVLAVQSGTTVIFPNQDDVRHHVYSFSHPNAFELKLYHGKSGANHQFEHEGVVVLGCNIHDGMLGYLRVVNTPLFATSDTSGSMELKDIPTGDYELQVWHPDIGMKVIRQPLQITSGISRKQITITSSTRQAPELKAAHPLQSLFSD